MVSVSSKSSYLGRIILTWALDLLYLFIYIVTFGKVTIHEGVYFKRWKYYINWNVDYGISPKKFVCPSRERSAERLAPSSEDAIVDIIKNATRVRVVGAGHSFNAGVLSDDVILSLDNYCKVVEVFHDTMQVQVQAGIRLRDFMKRIESEGLDMPTLGSTNAQSLGGLVATDLHGTAKTGGYLSNQIIWLKIVDAFGNVRKLERGKDDAELFAVPGAAGALGVVIELMLQCVPKYKLEKQVVIVARSVVSDTIQELLDHHDHLSFYYVGGTTIKSCRMNTWNRTVNDQSFLFYTRHFLQEVYDFVLCGFILGIGRVTKKLDRYGWIGLYVFKLFMNRTITTWSAGSFARKLFYRHDEIEYGLPLETFNTVMHELQYALNHNDDFVTIIEVRFAGPSSSLIGPGSGRPTVFIELAPSLSLDPTAMFTTAENIFKRYGGKPHLGKWTTATPEYMQRVHSENFTKFQEIRKRYDPDGKFSNDFIDQVFGR